MLRSLLLRSLRLRSLSSALLVVLAGCGEESAPAAEAPETSPVSERAEPVQDLETAGGPPLGRYVCRQYTATMGYLTLQEGGTYEVSGVRGRYTYDPRTGAMQWEGGSYDEWDWEGRYEHVTRPEGDGRPDEDVIRLNSEADGLKIGCFKMAQE